MVIGTAICLPVESDARVPGPGSFRRVEPVEDASLWVDGRVERVEEAARASAAFCKCDQILMFMVTLLYCFFPSQ